MYIGSRGWLRLGTPYEEGWGRLKLSVGLGLFGAPPKGGVSSGLGTLYEEGGRA